MVLPVGLRDMGPERGAWAQQGEAVPEERTGHPPLRGQRPAEASDALASPGGPGWRNAPRPLANQDRCSAPASLRLLRAAEAQRYMARGALEHL